jgi:hypothetical protein
MFKKILYLMALSSMLIQAGAQLFAVSVIVTTLSSNPTDSLAMLKGDYAYDSSNFWDIMPSITSILLLLAIIFNWKTHNRKYLIASILIFIAGALYSIFILAPAAEVHDSNWLVLDWILFFVTLLACILLLVPLAKR